MIEMPGMHHPCLRCDVCGVLIFPDGFQEEITGKIIVKALENGAEMLAVHNGACRLMADGDNTATAFGVSKLFASMAGEYRCALDVGSDTKRLIDAAPLENIRKAIAAGLLHACSR